MICRIGEVYGPTGRILKELTGKLRSGFCPWPGSGSVKISFIHAEDAAEALVRACEHAKPGFNVYNAGDDEPATWKQFLDAIAASLGVRSVYALPKPLAYGYALGSSWMENILGKPADVTPHLLRLLTTPKVMSNRRLREELGFVPQYTSIHTGLTDALGEK
jgi:nucleoside-diphosphate-sugar epimerase